MQSLGRPLTILSSVDSTNNYAMRMAHARMAKHGAAWLAWEQTRGKGQRGKEWIANKGENIYLSILTEPHFLKPVDGFQLVAAVAVGTYRFVKKHLGQNISIKWPNDIYWNDRKTVGILIENIIQSNKWLYAVLGIGVNINQVAFDQQIRNAISWKQITGLTYDIVLLTEELCDDIDASYRQLADDPAAVVAQYQAAMYKLDQPVTFRRGDEAFQAIVKGVSDGGQLIVEQAKQETLLEWGTVEWVVEQ